MIRLEAQAISSQADRIGSAVMSRNDKIAIICSVLLLLAILAAGAYGLSSVYYYDEPSPEDEPRER
jgi:hypothetical protein